MTILQVFPIVLSFLILAAHYLRSGDPLLTGVSVLLPLLMVVRRPWAARLVQAALLLGTLEWVRTLIGLARVRAQFDQPYLRMALILGVVAAVTALSALLFQGKTLGRLYGLRGKEQT